MNNKSSIDTIDIKLESDIDEHIQEKLKKQFDLEFLIRDMIAIKRENNFFKKRINYLCTLLNRRGEINFAKYIQKECFSTDFLQRDKIFKKLLPIECNDFDIFYPISLNNKTEKKRNQKSKLINKKKG